MKRTDVSDDGFNRIHVASRVPAWSFDLAPPSIHVPALPRLLGPDHCFDIGENVYWTENHDNAKLEFQAAICDYDIDVLQKTTHARFLRYPEQTGNNEDVHEKNSSGTAEPFTAVYVDYDDAGLHSRNTKSCSNAQLDRVHEPWEGLEDGHSGLVVTSYGTVRQQESSHKRCRLSGPRGACRGRRGCSEVGCSEDPGWPRLLRHLPCGRVLHKPGSHSYMKPLSHDI